MMSLASNFLLCVFWLVAKSEALTCEEGWTLNQYEELCIRVTRVHLTYQESNSLCLDGDGVGSLMMIKNQETQNILVNYLGDLDLDRDNIWLGAKYDPVAGRFRWVDGTLVEYANWLQGHPIITPDKDNCIQYLDSAMHRGKWISAPCRMAYYFVCQKPVLEKTERRTITEAFSEIEKVREEYHAKVENLRRELQDNLERVSADIVPVGSIYIGYYNQTSPGTLWPSMTWQDISSLYAGHFFRTHGGGAAPWGAIQRECAPRIIAMNYNQLSEQAYPSTTTIPSNGWSEFGHSGFEDPDGSFSGHGIQFNTAGCEVRPRNMAVKIWKRVA